jgi:protoheme IX farnesyltransferase
VVKGAKNTAEQVFNYTIFVVPLTFGLIYPLGESGVIYALFAGILGITFIVKTWELRQTPEDKMKARSVFKYSILYMMLLCTGIVVDSLPITHNMVSLVSNTIAQF